MIITDEYIKWFEQADEDTQASVYNHAIYTFSSLKFMDRCLTAFEILMGKKYCLWVSKNQK